MKTETVQKERIVGKSCEIYTIRHHWRELVANGIPVIEIYERSTEVSILGNANIGHKKYLFSIVMCMGEELDEEKLDGLMYFDIHMMLPRHRDGVYVPFNLYGVTMAEVGPEEWTFEVDDYETVKQLLNL